MFRGISSLTTITYGDNFVRKENSSITQIFDNCRASKSTHESWGDVTW